mgnify:FL=1
MFGVLREDEDMSRLPRGSDGFCGGAPQSLLKLGKTKGS